MKKRVMSTLLVTLLFVSLFCTPSLAYSPPPANAGLVADGIKWTTKTDTDMALDWSPVKFESGTIEDIAVNTAIVDRDAEYVQILWWDHGEWNNRYGNAMQHQNASSLQDTGAISLIQAVCR